jgi:hypothetical protein
MHYTAYRRNTERLAALTADQGARLEYLAGGCWGVVYPVEGCRLEILVAFSPDGDAGWLASVEDPADGSMGGSDCEVIGWVRRDEFATIPALALKACMPTIRAELAAERALERRMEYGYNGER